MKIILLIYLSSAVCVTYSYPNEQQIKEQKNIQSKRDTSFSYSAADIKSNIGSRIKTITIIKNVGGVKDKPIKIDPSYHKDENWGEQIHQNFDSFGAIPEVPDIDDLFDFTKQFKTTQKPIMETKEIPVSEKSVEIKTSLNLDENEKKIEITQMEEMVTIEITPMEEMVKEKISDDVELISPIINKNQKSQSIQYFPQKHQNSELINDNIQPLLKNDYITQYSTPHHKVRQYFLNGSTKKFAEYKKLPPYSKPFNSNNFSIYSPDQMTTFKTSSLPNTIRTPSYIVPSNVKKSQTSFNAQPTGKPFMVILTTSQTPYIAPKLKRAYQV